MAELNEVVAEAAEEVADQAENVVEVSRALDSKALSIGLLIGFGVGIPLGFGWANRRLRLKYEQIAEDEIDEMRTHFRARMVAREDKPDLGEAVKIAEREGYSAPNTPKVEERENGGKVGEQEEEIEVEVVVVEEVEEEETSETEVNVFESQWDYEEEVRLRRPDRPYIIHADEQHERNYTESTFTYYEGDDVLADERDNVIEDAEKVVGVANLDKFGHGSGDPNILYIRHDTLAIEVEVVKNDGSYAEVVHGFPAVEHSDGPDRRPRKRFDDEPDTG